MSNNDIIIKLMIDARNVAAKAYERNLEMFMNMSVSGEAIEKLRKERDEALSQFDERIERYKKQHGA